MQSKIRLPSPALVVALIALFVALGGTALAATPIVKRALYAENAGKLGGKAPAVLVQQAAAAGAKLPGPASTVAGLISVKTAPWTLSPGQSVDLAVPCDGEAKAVGGGFEDPEGYAHPWDTRPTADGSGWRMYIAVARDAPSAQNGTAYAVCVR